MKRKDKREVLILIGIAVMILVGWYFWPAEAEQTPPTPIPKTEPKIIVKVKEAAKVETQVTPATPVKPAVRQSEVSATPIPPSQAAQLYQRGVEIFETQPITSRTLLSAAWFSGELSQSKAADAIERLTWLGRHTLLDPAAIFVPSKDPYTLLYTFQSGDVLEKIERNQYLHVPSQILTKINGLTSGTQFQAGRTYKLIRGPFHAIVSKSRFTMDLYLHRSEDNLPKVFIKRYRVGLGRDSSTPLGKWRLGCGAKGEKGKAYHPGWDPPPNSGQLYRIEYGQPGYPFGSKGLWIGLVGTDENTRNLTDYGIHSTDNPLSIGTNASLGCIRMSDDDIVEVYSLLYEYWSTVEIIP